MKKLLKMIFIGIIVSMASQINIELISNDFRVSAGIIFFIILLSIERDVKPISAGLISGIMVYIISNLVDYLYFGQTNINNSYLFEIIFYIIYSTTYSLLSYQRDKDDIGLVFMIMVISDFFANFIEILIRGVTNTAEYESNIVFTIFIVSLVRSLAVYIVLKAIKLYNIFLLREEHEERYRNLLWLTSQIKTEMYWIEKNMDNIETVMVQSYNLFEQIRNKENQEVWEENALNIAREVHEIKKEHSLVVRGLKEIMENEFNDKPMNFSDIIFILEGTINREIKVIEKNIKLKITSQNDFYTNKHYYLMSILRNLIMNAMDAIKDTNENEIQVIHTLIENNHRFVVRDTGSGINQSDLKHIFIAGYSTKINYSTGEINRGLGLSIVRHIVEDQLKGNISVESIVGKGTKFYINIPKESLEDGDFENIYSRR